MAALTLPPRCKQRLSEQHTVDAHGCQQAAVSGSRPRLEQQLKAAHVPLRSSSFQRRHAAFSCRIGVGARLQQRLHAGCMAAAGGHHQGCGAGVGAGGVDQGGVLAQHKRQLVCLATGGQRAQQSIHGGGSSGLHCGVAQSGRVGRRSGSGSSGGRRRRWQAAAAVAAGKPSQFGTIQPQNPGMRALLCPYQPLRGVPRLPLWRAPWSVPHVCAVAGRSS